MTTSSNAGQVPVTLEIGDRLGRRLGGSLDPEGGRREIPAADILTFGPLDGPSGQFAALTRPDSSPYTATLVAERDGTFDLGIVVTGVNGQLQHVVFRGVTVSAGEQVTLTIRPRSDPPVSFTRSGTPVPATSEEEIVDGPPRVVGIVQIADRTVDRFGRVIGVLFDKDVEAPTAETAAAYSMSAATIPMIPPPSLTDRNAVGRGLVQPGGRIVLIGLRDPVGPFVRRNLDVSGVRDLRDQTMVPELAHEVLPDPEIGNGALVTGRVLRADGTPVANAEITYLQLEANPFGINTLRVLTVKPADGEGRYALDFVLQNELGPFTIRARDPATSEEGSVFGQVRADGERLSLDIVLVGRGSVEGVVRRQDGTPLPNAAVRLVSGTDFVTHAARTDQNGLYRFTGVTVGLVALEVSSALGSARASGNVAASATSRIDVTVFGSTDGVVTGIVRFPDGSSAAGVRVTLASETTVAGAPLPSLAFLDATTTDQAGTFRFDGVPPGGFLARAIDNAQGFIGDARVTVTDAHGPDNPASVVVLLGGTGSVSGQVFELIGTQVTPVAGALVAGGTQIVTADAQGRYTIPSVPVGIRAIEAVSPVTGARGSREVAVLTAGQVSTGIDIALAPMARVTGRVISPEGQPVAGQDVRIIIGDTPTGLGGRRFLVRTTQSAADGTVSFDQLDPREYPVTAVRGNEVANGRARLSPLVLNDVVDLRFVRGTGSVSGRVIDETGLAVAAQVALRARVPNAAGMLELGPAGTTTSDPDQGFRFSGLFPGPFTATATSFFSPDAAVASGTIPEANPLVTNVTLVLTRNTGSLSGCVLNPAGMTIGPVLDEGGVPLPLSVFISSPRLRDELEQDPLNTQPDGIRVDAGDDGCFVSSIPLPPDFYRIEVTDQRSGSPTLGLTGQAFATVARGAETIHNVRLLGLGSLAVEVVDAAGQALPGVRVVIRRTTYPNDLREAQLVAPTTTTPLLVSGLTEGPVSVVATVSSDPNVDVGGREELRGFGGNALGAVVRDEQRTLRVVIDSAGIVSGHFVRVDGVTPVAGAQIQLHSTGRPMAFGLTDATGSFRFNGVRVGNFHLDAFDPATGRRARADGRVLQDGQHVIQDLRLGPLGSVRGVVLDATRNQPQGGAEVRLVIPNDSAGPRQATAGLDGAFVFESVPGGAFTVNAVSIFGLSGNASSVLDAEGQVVEVEIALGGSGRVEGTVRNALGTPVALASVSLNDSFGNRRTTQAGPEGADAGRFVFDVVPMGSFTLEARPPGALTPGDGARSTGVVGTSGQTLVHDLTFQGTVTVGVVVSGAVGPAPVDVSLQSGGLFGGRAVPTGLEDGVVVFDGIPRAPMTVSARQVTPAGATISASVTLGQADLPPPGGRVTPDVQLTLTQVATVSGVATAEDGSPVSGARITLSAGNVTVLALTQPDGRFEFVGVPLNVQLRIDADGLTSGRAVFLGSIDQNGVIHDRQGTAVASVSLQLDVTPPRVSSVFPAAGAIAVPTNTLLTLTFSEPVDPATVTTCTPTFAGQPVIRLLESSATTPSINNPANLCDDSNVVRTTAVLSADGRSLTLTPQRVLTGQTQHTVIVSRGTIDDEGVLIGGVRDLVGLPLDADLTWQFVTRDDVPPVVLTLSPQGGAVNVPEESVVRVTFSEPIAPGSVNPVTFVVAGPAGSLTGTRELILGNTVAVFTPTDGTGTRAHLLSNATYSILVSGVADLSGNLQRPQDTVAVTFSTRDTIPPTIAAVTAPAGARTGESVSVTATTASLDVASVQFFVDGVLSATSAQPISPGQYRASVTMPDRSVQVTARAIDLAGNVGPLGTVVAIALLPDTAPSVTITSPAPTTTVAAGTAVRFTVDATDDVGVAEIRGASSGVVTTTSTRTISPSATSTTVFFDVVVPGTAPTGPLTFAAAALDTRAQTSPTASLTVNVTSEADTPAISSVDPATGNQGQTLNVTIVARNTHFVQGATTASFGGGIVVNSLTVNSPTTATANITIGTAAALGARTLTISTAGASVSLVNAFTVTLAPDVTSPQISQMTPAGGAIGVSLSTVITVTFSEAVDADTVTATTFRMFENGAPTQVAATIAVALDGRSATLDPAAQLQASTLYRVEVSGVTDIAGNTLTPAFQASFTTLDAGPGLISWFPFDDQVNPTADVVGGHDGTLVSATFSTGNIAPVVENVSSLSLNGSGAHVLVVDPEAFNVGATSPLTVSLWLRQSAVSPVFHVFAKRENCGPINYQLARDGSLVHFSSGSTLLMLGADFPFNLWTHVAVTYDGVSTARIYVNGVESASRTDFVMTGENGGPFTIGTAHGCPNSQTFPGALDDVKLYNRALSDAEVAAIAFHPRLESLVPNTARQAEAAIVAITGQNTHFAQGMTTASFGAGIAVNQLTINSSTTATATITVGPDAGLGARTVALTTADEVASLEGGFSVLPGVPVLFSLNPTVGRQGETLDVTVNGRFTHFVQGITQASFGADIVVNSVMVLSSTSARVNVTIDAGAATGARTVTMSTAGEVVSLAGVFTVQTGTPVLLSVAPSSGQRGRDLVVVVSGRFTHFADGATTASFGPGISVGGAAAGQAGPVTVTSQDSLMATVSIAATAVLGFRDVVIQTGGETVTRAGGFAVTAALANSEEEFSCTQGQHNWYYGYYDGPFTSSDFQQMTACIDDPWIPGPAWWVDSNRFWTSIRSVISFPNGPLSCGRESVEHWAVRRWSSEVSGLVTVTGSVYTALGGDFRAHILVDGTVVFTQLVSSTTPAPYAVTFPVSVGSTVDFAVQPNESDCDDWAAFTATVVTGDLTAPTVTAVNPPNGSVGVPANTAIQISFSQPVEPSTVTSSTFRLFESSASTAPLVLNGGFDTDAAGWTAVNFDAAGGWFAAGGNPGGHFVLNHNGGPTDPTISQVVSGLTVGRRYRLSGQFAAVYTEFGDPAALSFGVSADGVTLGELTRPPSGQWTDFAFVFTASSSSTTIALSAERNGDDSSYGVDNIALDLLLDGSVVVAADARGATLTPATELSEARTYRVEVAGVADPAGTQMTAPFQSAFTTAFIVAIDSDGDGFPDAVETALGSDPFNAGITPLSVQPAISEAVSPPFAVLNTSAGSADPAALITEAVSPPFSVLNTIGAATDPAAVIVEAVSPAFSVLNTVSVVTDPTVAVAEAVSPAFAVLNTVGNVTDPAITVAEAVSPGFAVLNTTSLGGVTDPSVFIGEAVSPFFGVDNSPGAGQSAAATTATLAAAPTVTITSPASGLTVFEGQTIAIAVNATGGGLVWAQLSVNGAALAQDVALPYTFLFTVPDGVTDLSLQVSVSNDQGAIGVSEPVTLTVAPDPLTTVIGRLVGTNGMPVANTDVTIALDGLRADYFDFTVPLAALPDLNGLVPTRTAHVSAVNVRNPDGLFGSDPFGVDMNSDYAARFTGYLWIEQPGSYTFRLAADEGARLVIGGVTVVQMPTGQGDLQAFSQSIDLPAGWIPIEITYYESIGDAELQLQSAPTGGELLVVPPGRLRTAAGTYRVQTDALGQFVITNVPANVPGIRVFGASGDLSSTVAPVPGGVTDLGDVVID